MESSDSDVDEKGLLYDSRSFRGRGDYELPSEHRSRKWLPPLVLVLLITIFLFSIIGLVVSCIVLGGVIIPDIRGLCLTQSLVLFSVSWQLASLPVQNGRDLMC